ncbi:glycoside hydrolase family 2 protein [Schaalia suimastitidis]|uniref:glycoside hydrolase family 2 protein n=1 Tax=Schaalia suimastitidis TaxID=121163 RepID=UPI000A0390B9|nr:sugar-binding domain-containing protein [Schaalia suimastitidis]
METKSGEDAATANSPLCSPWGENLDDTPLPEHPDPMHERSQWCSLNGWWDYAIRPIDESHAADEPWDGQIRVPFAVEWAASGVERPFTPRDVLHYHRRVDIPSHWRGMRLRINFGAVDHDCTVYVNGRSLGSHSGGYLPFSVTIDNTDCDSFELRVTVTDPTDSASIQRGKQALTPTTIWYTATSGIWQSVWMEPLPCEAADTIADIDLRADSTLSGFYVRVRTEADLTQDSTTPIDLAFSLPDAARVRTQIPSGRWCHVRLPDAQPWSPEAPHLYEVHVATHSDRVRTWAALRSVGLAEPRRGFPFRVQTRGQHDTRVSPIVINGVPTFLNAPLHQGYWPESGLTAPSEEALLHDLTAIKTMGFNGVRVHIKVESRRFYYHCDRLGLLVVQDMVSGGRAVLGITASGVAQALDYTLPDRSHLFFDWSGRGERANRAAFAHELAQMIRYLRCHPSIIMWVPFNEGWGQFNATRAEKAVRRLDPTRLVDAVSGWFDQGGGDFRSRHRYVLRLIKPPAFDPRPFYLSEFGGLNLAVDGHTWHDPIPFGYRFMSDASALAAELAALYREQLIPLVAHGLVAATYTQVSDVERENNGLMTYDRKVMKVDPAFMALLNGELYAEFARHMEQRAAQSTTGYRGGRCAQS